MIANYGHWRWNISSYHASGSKFPGSRFLQPIHSSKTFDKCDELSLSSILQWDVC